MYKEVDGNLITMALEGKFDVVAQGNNCFCVQGAGIAPQFVEAFGTDQFKMELKTVEEYTDDDPQGEPAIYSTGNKGDINKLGQIDYETKYLWFKHPMLKKGQPSIAMNHMTVGQKNVKKLVVVNCYTQYGFGMNHKDGNIIPLDYAALELCLKKINHVFAGQKIGLPQIGCGLAGGDWNIVKLMIQTWLDKMDVTVVIYKPPIQLPGVDSKKVIKSDPKYNKYNV